MNNAVNFDFMLALLEHYVARKSALTAVRGRTMSKRRYNLYKKLIELSFYKRK